MASEYLTQLGLQTWKYENPPKFESFWFERMDGNEMRYWARQQLPMCVATCAAYFILINIGPIWMKNRKPFNLQGSLVAWNSLLALFSICGVIRLLPEFFYLFSLPNGFHLSACTLEGVHYSSTFWGFLFTLSKIAELGDTVFIVLRKKPLIFLHWFHHLTMVWTSFYTFSIGEPYMRYIALINMSVHSLMYTYYAAKALNIRVPKRISMMITSLQILQFIAVLFINLYTLVMYARGNCYRKLDSVGLTLFITSFYLFLFAKLFYKSYIFNKSKTN